LGREILDNALLSIRQMIESCENFEGFLIINSALSGTGAGFTHTLLNRLKATYDKKIIILCVVCASSDLTNGPMEIYNISTYMMESMESDAVLLYNNQGLYSVFENQLGIRNSNFSQINELMSQSLSSILLGSREARGTREMYTGNHKGLTPIIQLLISFPRLKLFDLQLVSY
jgi:hypothetical protein